MAAVISVTSPTNGSTVDIDTAPFVVFSTGIQPNTIVFAVQGVAGTVSYNSGIFTSTFTPNSLLSYRSTYSISITGVIDTLGNAVAPSSWVFNTINTTFHQFACWDWGCSC